MSDIRALEHGTLKVPYEILNKKFRNAQKIIDKEVSHIGTQINELNSNTTVSEATASLNSIVQKLKDLKRKAEDAVGVEKDTAKNCKARVEHLKEHSDKRRHVKIIWKRERLDRMLVDHFLRSGYYETACLMAKTSGVEKHVDVDLFLASRKVEEALHLKNSAPCLAWCHENKSKLRKMKSSLELNIRIQEFVELIKEERRMEAVLYARKHFSLASNDSHCIPEIQKTMALLAFKPDCKSPRYQELFNNNRWEDLVQQFRNENFALHQLNCQSVLEVALQCGLASLKTPYLFMHTVPHSSLLREAINEHNPPMMLPNGFAYGENALQAMALLGDDDTIQCPRTKEKFKLDDAQRIYVM
eukprot:gene5592-6281_t